MSRHPSRTVAFNMKQRPKLLFPYHPTCFFSLHIHNTSLRAPGRVGSSRTSAHSANWPFSLASDRWSFLFLTHTPCTLQHSQQNKQTNKSQRACWIFISYGWVEVESTYPSFLPSFLPSFHLWRQFQTLTIEIHNKMPLIQIWKQTTLPCVRVMYYWLSTVSTCVFKSTFFIEKQKNYLRVRKKNKKTLSLCRVIAFISK